MDGRTLMDIMQSPNFSMWGPAENAFKLDQQKKQADLASIMGQEDRARQMLPLQMEQSRQAARMSGGQADIYADQIARKIPVEDERKAALQASIAKMDGTTRAQMKAKVLHSMQLAAAMKKNGGMLPEGFNLSPEEMQIYKPQNLDKIIAHGQAFMEMDPEWISARKKAQEAQALENTRAANRVELKTTPSGGTLSMAPPKMNLEQQMNYYNSLALKETDEAKKKVYQAEADRLELMIYRKAIEAQKARDAGNPNLADPRFGIPVNPIPNPQPTPRNDPAVTPSSGSPAQTKMTLTKLQEMYPGVPADKLKEAFKKKFGVDVQ